MAAAAAAIVYSEMKFPEVASNRSNLSCIQQPENESCRLCPMMWLLHKEKCYWFSTTILSWEKSKNDCIAKKSQLAVIYDQEQKEFLQNNTKNGVETWIGLSLAWPEKKWVWVDDSPLNRTLSPSNRILKDSCGALKAGTDINLGMCSVELNWICQKESVPL